MARRLATLLLAAVACSKGAGRAPAPEAQLATDLPGPVIDTALRLIAQAGGPAAERIPGAAAGAGALEADAPPARKGDVWWDSEPYGAIAAARRDELMPIPFTANDVPALWRDPGRTWVAVGGRAVVLLIAADLPKDRVAPNNYAAVTQPWLKGKVAIAAPTGGPSLAHFAALFQAWGEARMHGWMKQLEANEAQILDTDDAVRQAVVSGKALVGILSSDEAAKAAASAARVTVEYPNQGSIGTFVWPTALARPKNAPHPQAAAQLADRLGSRDIEQLLVARVPGYLPLRASIAVPPGVTSAANLVVVSVDPARIVAEIAARRTELANWTKSMRRQ
jgi:iron(III) transport system substrate-binding protein